jgi:hypothetical protein
MAKLENDGGGPGASPPPPQRNHGGSYWLFVHLFEPTMGPIWRFVKRHKWAFITVVLLATFGLYMFRPLVQPFFLLNSNHLLLILTYIIVIGFGAWRTFKKGLLRKVIWIPITAGAIYALFMWGGDAYYLLNLYWRYETLNIVQLQKMALTDHERILPLITVRTDIQQKISGGQEATNPSFVRDNDKYVWTSLISSPDSLLGWVGATITTVKVISATDENPNWKDVAADMGVGEQLYLSHQMHTCVVRSLGPLQYFSYEPAEVRAIRNDAGDMVQVVSLIHWAGIGYRPEYGGVIVSQEGESPMFSWNWLKLVFTGCGEWIPPQEVTKHAFLKGQNLVPELVGRFIAESFRFQGGLQDPLWGHHISDVRIPVLPDDYNEQPIVQYLRDIPGEEGKLYQTFSLEPHNPEKQGFSLAVMLPGDSDDRVFTFKPDGLTGITAIPAKVRPTNTIISWANPANPNGAFPSEPRWFVRDINGQRLFFIYTSIVTKDEQTGRANAGVTSDIPVTDPRGSTQTFWMKQGKPDAWVKTLEEAFPASN